MKRAQTYALRCGFAAACMLVGSSGCSDKSSSEQAPRLQPVPQAASAQALGVLARVNGVAITENEVLLKTKKGPKAELTPARKKAIVETLIREELVRQAALARGLDADASYAAEDDLMRARRAEFERGKLGQLFFRKQVVGSAKASEADARAFFDANKTMMETDLHVMQILRRRTPEIAEDLSAISSGTAFEEVAARRFPSLPAGRAPWDLGFLKWKQIPKAWRAQVYDLEPGATSQIIRGPKNRFWILKLVSKRVDSTVSFATVKSMILDELEGRAIAELRAKAIADLRASATIEYVSPGSSTSN